MYMFIRKQFKNFDRSNSVYFFRDCVFEVTRANSIQITFSILEISTEEVHCTSKIKLALLAHERERFLAKCRQIIYCVTSAFAGNLLATQFCKVCNYVFRSNFFSEKCFSI